MTFVNIADFSGSNWPFYLFETLGKKMHIFLEVSNMFGLCLNVLKISKILAQSLLGEFRWGSFFFLFLLPRESKVNSQVSPGVGVWQKGTFIKTRLNLINSNMVLWLILFVFEIVSVLTGLSIFPKLDTACFCISDLLSVSPSCLLCPRYLQQSKQSKQWPIFDWYTKLP